MGCCGKSNKTIKNKSNVTKTEEKKNLINNKEKKIISQNQILKTESNIPKELISSPEYDIDDFINQISSTDNISPIKTLNDLQTFVEQNKKSVSIVFFYGRYCPYSKRTMPDLRQWAQENKDRIFLYEADVEQASKLAEYYHIRTIPTIMAFDKNNLLAPIWQRTANNVLSSPIDESETINNSNEKSITSSEQSPYIWDRSIQSVDNDSQQSSKELTIKYNGRMISQSTISNDDQLKKKRTWSDYLDDNRQINEYQQHIHLPNSNEIFYEKQFDNSLSSDRFSTLTYEHVKDLLINPQEKICILYLGPNRHRGFEDNLSDKTQTSSKYSLLTLKSHLLSE